MDKQPEALRLAEGHEMLASQAITHEEINSSIVKLVSITATELRRLHTQNQELVEALKSINSICQSDLQYRQFPSSREYEIINICEALIAKHKEQA